MVFGTFDGLHEGHLNFFEQARAFGDCLIVIVGRDVNILRVKKHLPKKNENQRLQEVKSCKLIDEALLGDKENPYTKIAEIKPDVVCLGYDQLAFTDKLAEKIKELGLKTEVFRMKPFEPEKYHSSIINK